MEGGGLKADLLEQKSDLPWKQFGVQSAIFECSQNLP